jgi:Spx/MgsR family transcriptional regulator
MAIILYGIPNCETVKKARSWLEARQIAYAFHDYKKSGVPAAKLDGWVATAGWDKVLNRAGATFRKLPPEAKMTIDAASARRLMLAQPSIIKRPIVEHPGGLLIGFAPAEWEAALKT